jgi:hypothetical protein
MPDNLPTITPTPLKFTSILALIVVTVILGGLGIIGTIVLDDRCKELCKELTPEYRTPPPAQKALTTPKRTEYQYIQDSKGSHLATMAGVTLCDAPCEQPTKGVSVTCVDCLEAIEAALSYEDDH